MNRFRRVLAAWRGAPLATEYPRIVMLGGGCWATVQSPKDEQETRDWLRRMSNWNGEHER